MSQSSVDTGSPPAAERSPRRGSTISLLVALVLVTLNLRPAVSALSALLTPLRETLGLSSLAVSVATTLPTLGLALFSFLAPRLCGRLGDERLINAGIGAILVGDLVRAVPGDATVFFVGTILISAGIGLVTGAVPGLIKREFPDRVASMMALYTTVLTIGASGASALAPVLAQSTGSAWSLPLATITVPLAVLAAAWWLPRLTRRPHREAGARIPAALWRDATAWWVTVFFAATGFVFYVVLNWMPTLAHDRGMSPTASGLVLATVALVQVVGSLSVPVVIRRTADQRVLATTLAVINVIGLATVILAPVPAGIWIGAVVLGLGQGGGFGLAMTFIGLRAPDASRAGGLGGMAQGIGYTASAVGPLVAGLLHGASGGWTSTLIVLVVVCAVQLVAGLGAGRRRHVLSATPTGTTAPAA